MRELCRNYAEEINQKKNICFRKKFTKQKRESWIFPTETLISKNEIYSRSKYRNINCHFHRFCDSVLFYRKMGYVWNKKAWNWRKIWKIIIKTMVACCCNNLIIGIFSIAKELSKRFWSSATLLTNVENLRFNFNFDKTTSP